MIFIVIDLHTRPRILTERLSGDDLEHTGFFERKKNALKACNFLDSVWVRFGFGNLHRKR